LQVSRALVFLLTLSDWPDTIGKMAELNPLAVMRVALGDGADWARTLTRRGADLADRLLGLVVRRGDAVPLAGAEAAVPDGPEAAVEAAKYRLGPDVAPGRPDGALPALPDDYGRDRLVLLPRDPRSAFAYWEITAPARARGLAALGAAGEGARIVLRVQDAAATPSTGENAWSSFDLEPADDASSAYVALPRASVSCRAEIGLRSPDGRFFPLAASDSVTLPAAAVATDTTVRWVELTARARPLVIADRGEPLDEGVTPRR
jgi:hypothetical protein